MLHNSTVIHKLLQSCYTGILQFSAKDIVNYLTAASYLQMEHVVEKCRSALGHYLQPKGQSALEVSPRPSLRPSVCLCLTDTCLYTTTVHEDRGVAGHAGDRERRRSGSHVAPC